MVLDHILTVHLSVIENRTPKAQRANPFGANPLI